MATGPQASTTTSSASALSFISKGWREVRNSADADLQLMRDRANSLKSLATSFDREWENFINSAATPFSVPAIRSYPPAEIDFVKKLQPKLTEFRRTYSAPDFSKKVLEKWRPSGTIRIDLSAIRKAIVSQVEEISDYSDDSRVRAGRGVRTKEFWDWDESQFREWEPNRALKIRLREFEKRSAGFTSSELLEKFKSRLKAMCEEHQESKIWHKTFIFVRFNAICSFRLG